MALSENIFLYITLGLGSLLVILLTILLIKRLKSGSANNNLKKALESKGIIIEKEEKPSKKKDISNLLSKGIPDDKDITKISEQLRAIIENEKLLKQKEQVFTQEIENLYNQTQGLRPDTRKKVKKEGRDVMGEDIKKELRIKDDLLEKLPQEAIDNFVKSPDFKLYQKVVKEAKK